MRGFIGVMSNGLSYNQSESVLEFLEEYGPFYEAIIDDCGHVYSKRLTPPLATYQISLHIQAINILEPNIEPGDLLYQVFESMTYTR